MRKIKKAYGTLNISYLSHIPIIYKAMLISSDKSNR